MQNINPAKFQARGGARCVLLSPGSSEELLESRPPPPWGLRAPEGLRQPWPFRVQPSPEPPGKNAVHLHITRIAFGSPPSFLPSPSSLFCPFCPLPFPVSLPPPTFLQLFMEKREISLMHFKKALSLTLLIPLHPPPFLAVGPQVQRGLS